MKRMLDWALGMALLLVFAPLFGIVALLIALDGGPVFYGHPRIGFHGKSFRCFKFRTMIVGAHDCLDEYLMLHPVAAVEWQDSQKLDADPRITAIGKFLRRSSLDELPQLWNVVCGDMSLVGPRPVTAIELVRYGSDADQYKTVRPGITGLWQISGRNRLNYAERVRLDMRYITSHSLWQDCIILLKTLRVPFRGDGK